MPLSARSAKQTENSSKVLCAGNPELAKILVTPGVGDLHDLHVLPSARNTAFPVHSTSFSLISPPI